MKKSLSILLLLITLSGCDPFGIWMDKWSGFGVQNTTDQHLYLYVVYILPDTCLPAEKPKLIEVGTGENNIRFINGTYFKDSSLKRLKKGELLSVFFLLKDSVDAKPWSYIRDNNVVLDRYDLSWEVFESYQWKVPYPLPSLGSP